MIRHPFIMIMISVADNSTKRHLENTIKGWFLTFDTFWGVITWPTKLQIQRLKRQKTTTWKSKKGHGRHERQYLCWWSSLPSPGPRVQVRFPQLASPHLPLLLRKRKYSAAAAGQKSMNIHNIKEKETQQQDKSEWMMQHLVVQTCEWFLPVGYRKYPQHLQYSQYPQYP